MRVTTASGSVYEIDFDASTVTRIPGEASNKLRQDGETVPLIDTNIPVIGESLIMTIDVRGDGIQTIRWTTAITSIEESRNE